MSSREDLEFLFEAVSGLLHCCDGGGASELRAAKFDTRWENYHQESAKDQAWNDTEIIQQRNSMLHQAWEERQKALSLINQYGGSDGAHHLTWVLDQVVRILVDDYDEWVRKHNAGEDGPDTYAWNTGIAP